MAMAERPIFTPWTFNVYVHDSDWVEIEELRRVNVTINVVTALLQSWKNVLADQGEPVVKWQMAIKKGAVVSVEVNRG